MASEGFPTSDAIGGLSALITRAAEQSDGKKRGLPPVELWNPAFCGDIDLEIRGDGSWYYMGTPIGRQPLVRLFSTVLRKDEDGKTYLVTPVEKLGIRVEDAHFVAVEVDKSLRDSEPVLTFRTNVGDVVEAGADHPLSFVVKAGSGEWKPYLRVRGRLDALVSRAVTYELAEMGDIETIEGVDTFCLRSNGALFPIMPADELDALSR
ncbi:DUF1285 domain-containing protein [Oryzifoliimicrobium ureilyticus]|uniref:DUF1285 domain-containing protein n=1 Tax=Oryzifoliimicrobium ureilyticus TaxID=3113724 RepID=UPI0030760148